MIRQNGEHSEENNFCYLNKELEHPQILGSELVIELNVWAFVQTWNNKEFFDVTWLNNVLV